MRPALFAFALTACATRGGALSEPLVDHHAHLVSEAARRLHAKEPLPAVTLPPELDRVLREYERVVREGDVPGYAAMFVEDGLLDVGANWVRGRRAIERDARASARSACSASSSVATA